MLVDDALRAVDVVRSFDGPIVDVGSGGGSPGIPLAFALPDREVTLLEAERRKCDFLEQWAPPNARVVWGRAEEQGVDTYGVALAKALAQPATAVEWCLPLVRPGGAVVLWLGPSADLAAVAQRGRASRRRRAGGTRAAWSSSGSSRQRRQASRGALAWRRSGPWLSRPRPVPATVTEAPPLAHGHRRRAANSLLDADLGVPAICGGRDSSVTVPGTGRVLAHPSGPVARMGRMARIYALANQKGGVGKTTTAINLAACLAEAGERALVIDLDPQANATSGLGMRANGTSSYDLLDGAPLSELTKHTAFANLDIVPSKPDLAGAVVELAQRTDGERYLSQALASGTSQYDFVFLDCPPSLGPLTVNALAAADRVLVPVQAEYYALEGLSQLMQSIDLIRRRLNPSLGIGGVLLTMVDSRTRLAQDVEAEVRKHFGPLVFRTSVPRSVRLAEAPSHGLPAIAYDRRSAGADAYWKVAMELVERA